MMLYWKGITFVYINLNFGLSGWIMILDRYKEASRELRVAIGKLHAVIQDVLTTFTMLLVATENFRANSTFCEMQRCQNSVVSDRVAIFSNIMGYRTRMEPTPMSSYSELILHLLSINFELPRIIVSVDDTIPKTWFQEDLTLFHLIHHTIDMQTVVREGAAHFQSDLLDLKYVVSQVSDIDLSESTTRPSLSSTYTMVLHWRIPALYPYREMRSIEKCPTCEWQRSFPSVQRSGNCLQG